LHTIPQALSETVRPLEKIGDVKIIDLGDAAVASGLYTFSYRKDGQLVELPARYTFVYRKTPHGWAIIRHHSSALPEAH
jgi:hypothetical protein